MASVRRTPRGRYELTIRNRLLPKPVYLTFDTEPEARAYGDQVDRLLAAGVVKGQENNPDVRSFIEFLNTPEAQAICAKSGLRTTARQ